jgi:glycosyltransferase involved in cell wall biosynthesis
MSAALCTRKMIYPTPPPLIDSMPETDAPRPFWSVMMPAYRPDAAYLRQALESVLQQAPGPEQMQIEVVDDCSPGVDVAALVKAIAGKRVEFSRTPKNLGLAGCWNTCIERARGEWVHILHQDDLVLTGFYEKLKAGCQSKAAPGLVYCRHAFVDGDGHRLGLSGMDAREPGNLENPLPHLALRQRIQTPAVAVRRSVYEALGGFRSDLAFALDWEMWCRIARQHPVWYEPAILAWYRIHASAETARLRLAGSDIDDIRKCIEIVGDYLPEKKLAARVRRTALDYYAIQALQNGWEMLCVRRFRPGVRQIRRAFKCGVSPRILWRVFILGMKTLQLAATKAVTGLKHAFNA